MRTIPIPPKNRRQNAKTRGPREGLRPGWLVGIHARNAPLAVKMADRSADLAGSNARLGHARAQPRARRELDRQARRAKERLRRRHAHRRTRAQRVDLDALAVSGDDTGDRSTERDRARGKNARL